MPLSLAAMSSSEELPDLSLAAMSSSEELPDELIREILSRVPAQSLLRLRCVSKSWTSLIGKLHLFQNRPTREIYVFHLPENGYYPSDRTSLILNLAGFDLVNCCSSDDDVQQNCSKSDLNVKVPLSLSKVRSIRLVGSCDGFICLRITYSNQIVLINPLTRQDYFLSPPETRRGRRFSDIGFGYDKTSDGHKVVLVQRPSEKKTGRGNVADVNIYDFKSETWKHMQFPWNYNNCIAASWGVDLDRACCINNGIHWLLQDRGSLSFKDGFYIATFDLAKEKLMVAEYDGEVFGYPHSVYLGVLGGYLSLTCIGSHERYNYEDIWIMKEYGVKESWSKFLSFDRPLMPLALSNCGRRLLFEAWYWCDNRCRCSLHWYDLDNKSFHCTHRIKFWEAYGGLNVCVQSHIQLEKC